MSLFNRFTHDMTHGISALNEFTRAVIGLPTYAEMVAIIVRGDDAVIMAVNSTHAAAECPHVGHILDAMPPYQPKRRIQGTQDINYDCYFASQLALVAKALVSDTQKPELKTYYEYSVESLDRRRPFARRPFTIEPKY